MSAASAFGNVGIVGLIFGGCCSNVFALEALLRHEPDSGLLVTLSQFVLITAFLLPSHLDSNSGGLRAPQMPLRKLAVSAIMFFSVNMLNNWAFAFQISVPVHIILRSFGSVTTMAAGWLRGKRYSFLQVLSVLALTAGVIVSAWADASSKGKSMSAADVDLKSTSFNNGLAILFIAQLLSAFMGAYVEDMFRDHGKHWSENLFYCHVLSLPLFLGLLPTLQKQFIGVAATPPLSLPPTFSSILPASIQSSLPSVPSGVFLLLVNALTQMGCITGVNLLSANASAVTVTIVLNIRKLVSFIFSIVLFGNEIGAQMALGAVLVFGSGALYGYESTVRIPRTRQAETERAKARNGILEKRE